MSFQKGFENDDEAALAEAMKVVELVPDSPRGWLNVAFAQAALEDFDAERATAAKILETSPGFLPAYFQLANSYLFNEPRDFGQAEANAQKMVELAPNEQNSHDILGDVHRALGHGRHAAALHAVRGDDDLHAVAHARHRLVLLEKILSDADEILVVADVLRRAPPAEENPRVFDLVDVLESERQLLPR